MRSKFITSLCSLVVLCCVASLTARAQDAAQSPTQPKKKPATASQTAKKPAATQNAKKSAATTTQTSKPTATKTTTAQAPAKPATTTAQAAAAKRLAAKKAAAKSAAAKNVEASGDAATEKNGSSDDAATKKDAAGDATKNVAGAAVVKKQAAPKPRAPKKTPVEADATKTAAETAETGAQSATETKPASEKKTASKKTATEKKTTAATGDAATTQTASPKTDAPKTEATPSKPGAASKSAKLQASKGQKEGEAKQETVAFDPAKEAELKAKLEEILKLPAWERIAELQDFLDQEMPDAVADRAAEHLVSSQAAYGDERLQAGDAARGVALFRQAVDDASDDMSDKLFFEVIAQLPANLVLRGQPVAAFELAHKIEPAAKGDAKRLLALAAFYLTAERPADASRLAARAVKLSPDLAAAHQALAAAERFSLRLDESVAEYARAAELDPKSVPARQSLADMRRATGKPEEALAIYRELLAADSTDRAARDGVVLSLFDAGKREEAERELEAALKESPRDLQLLAGAAYWYAAHGDQKRALELSGQAVQIEPRHPWAQVALARSLVANNLAADAERALRFARIYSHFPTLDYELASALAASGLYAEAADELAHTFSIKDDQIATQLAGRTDARAQNFVELLAPERRASFFAHDAADTDANARSLKGLLALHLALKSAETKEQRTAIESAAATAAKEFAAGDDAMRAFRQLYAAERLLRRGVASHTALELVEAAKGAVNAAIDTPQATVAVTADELRDMRADAINQGGTPSIPDLPRDILDSLLRGRIEELTGRALLDEGKNAEAVAALQRAVGVLPEKSLYWRNALWRLGTALAASGARQDALNTYIQSYDRDAPDAARLAVIEALYRRLNGSLSGLDVLLGAATLPTRQPAPAKSATVETAQPDATKTDATKTDETKRDEAKRDATKRDEAESKDAASKSAEVKGEEAKKVETKDAQTAQPSTPATDASTTPIPTVTPTPEPVATPNPTPAPTPDAETKHKKADEKDDKKVEEKKSDEKKADEKKADDVTPTSATNEHSAAEPSRTPRAAGECALSISSDVLSVNGGGSASVVATLDGEGDAAKITATTPNWSDIIVLREPSNSTAANSAKFTVTSISKSGGTFAVTIKSPCGAKQLTVTVK
jgi:tetratricopeptide (TPR) repeat protein